MAKRVLEIEEKGPKGSLAQLFVTVENLAHREMYKEQYTVLKGTNGYQAHLGAPAIDHLTYLPRYRSLQAALKALIAREQDRIYEADNSNDEKAELRWGNVLRGKTFGRWRKNAAITLGQIVRSTDISTISLKEWEDEESVSLTPYQANSLKGFISTRADIRTQSRLWTDEEADDDDIEDYLFEDEDEDDDEDDV